MNCTAHVSADVNTDNPDERSIITYVATYYHYFSRLKSGTVQAKRVARVINEQIELAKEMERYEWNAAELLKWIREKIRLLDEREFPNRVAGVQSLLATFASYRTTEKPPK